LERMAVKKIKNQGKKKQQMARGSGRSIGRVGAIWCGFEKKGLRRKELPFVSEKSSMSTVIAQNTRIEGNSNSHGGGVIVSSTKEPGGTLTARQKR